MTHSDSIAVIKIMDIVREENWFIVQRIKNDKKTINIFFIILGIIITTISVQKLLFIPLLIGLAAPLCKEFGDL